MTQEEKAKRYDDVFERAKAEYAKFEGMLPGDVLENVFSELKEDEDEKIKKDLIRHFEETIENIKSEEIIPHSAKILVGKMQKWITWLEKQDNTNIEQVFRPSAGCCIDTAAKQAIEQQKQGKNVVLAFNGCYIPVKNNTIDTIVGEYYTWLEKQGHEQKLEVKDPYEQCVQYDSIKAGIQAHAKTYSFNIESVLFPQLTKEQQKLWKKEIEQACISGGNAVVSLWKPSDEQIKTCKEVYADLLSAKGFDIGTVNSELNRLEEDLKKLKG